MFVKILVLCGSALLVQLSLSCERLGRITEPFTPSPGGLAYDEFGFGRLGYDATWPKLAGCGISAPTIDISAAKSLNAAHGGGLSVSSSSCAAPTGLAVTSENAYEGGVAVTGNLPFLGIAAMEGVFPTAGLSAISYGCGDGVVGITAEEPIRVADTPPVIAPGAIASSIMPWGYKGIQSCGC